jgi:hypothetical protein
MNEDKERCWIKEIREKGGGVYGIQWDTKEYLVNEGQGMRIAGEYKLTF